LGFSFGKNQSSVGVEEINTEEGKNSLTEGLRIA